MSERYLVDTDVLIEFLRGRSAAVRFLRGLRQPARLSAVTVAELSAGARDEDEQDQIDDLIHASEVLPVDEKTAMLGGRIRKDHRPRTGIGLPDALIAAAAILTDSTLVTYDRKHFPMLDKVLVPDHD